MMRAWAAVLVLAACCLSTAAIADAGESYELRHPPYLASLRIEPHDERGSLCVMAPTVAGDCTGVDTQSVVSATRTATANAGELVSFSAIRFDDAVLTITVIESRLRGYDLSAEDLDGSIQGIRRAIDEGRGSFLKPPQQTTIHGIRAIVYDAETPTSAGTSTISTYTFFGHDRVHTITFTHPHGATTETRASAEHILRTLQYKPGDLGQFGEPRATVVSYHVTKALIAGVPLLICIGLVIRHIVAKKTAKRTAAPPS